ncbi:MAG: hypothetical protein M1813_007923 [Trichoglossum hirsutum]|nr:MAG: hypothetical protein M1813_007923 [Trichoglossum hirsutum]
MEELLKNNIMFEEVPEIELDKIIDSMTFSKNGYWFIDLLANNLKSNAEFLLHKAVKCIDKHRLFHHVHSTNGKTREWHNERRKGYLRDVKKFQELLLVLMHFTS